MKKIFLFFIIATVVGMAGIAVFLLSGNGEHLYYTIERETFEKTVEVSGKVAPITEASLGFQSSGAVSNIFVEVGDEVEKGNTLVQQDNSSLQANLASAQANASIASSDYENAQINLQNVVAKQNALVASARAKLYSEGLTAVAQSASYTQTVPIISGRYNGTLEGSYKIVIERDNTRLNAIEMSVFGIEEVRDVPVSKTNATALGTRGLFVSFPDADTSYSNTTWFVHIPNKEASAYLANLNAYQEALEERENAIQVAKDELRFQNENLSIAEAERLQAEAEIKQIEVQLSQSKIVAPFDGIISTQEAQVGEVAQAGEVVVEMIGSDGLKLEVFIPEVNIAGIRLGQEAEILLDAYGPNEIFTAEVVKIDPTETLRDGISTYKTTFYFKENNPRIRSGMTADVTITTDKRENVLLIPRRAVLEEDGNSYVLLDKDGNIVKTLVETGAYDSYGNTEVISGLEEGTIVILNPER